MKALMNFKIAEVVDLFGQWLKFVPDWSAISVSSWQQPKRDVWGKWYGLGDCLLFHS
jgi:hypothetical protein